MQGSHEFQTKIQTIDDHDLLRTCGGADNQPTTTGNCGQQEPQGDFADRYVKNVQDDLAAIRKRGEEGRTALSDGKYWTAAKSYGKGLLDCIGFVADAMVPVRALKG
jgi:hypothetical protein